MKLIFCGHHRAGYEALMLLISQELVSEKDLLVFTHDKTASKDLIEACSILGIPFFTDSINLRLKEVVNFKPEIILSCYYRNIIHGDILRVPVLGSLNVHPSLLPNYKGAFSSPWAIINNESKTGVTIHEMVEEIDAGKILLQEELNIRDYDTAFSLYHRLTSLAIFMLPKALKYYLEDGRGIEQSQPDPSKAYFSRGLPFGGILPIEDTSFQEAARFVRAMYFPPFEGAKFKDKNDKVFKANSIKELKNKKLLWDSIKES